MATGKMVIENKNGGVGIWSLLETSEKETDVEGTWAEKGLSEILVNLEDGKGYASEETFLLLEGAVLVPESPLKRVAE